MLPSFGPGGGMIQPRPMRAPQTGDHPMMQRPERTGHAPIYNSMNGFQYGGAMSDWHNAMPQMSQLPDFQQQMADWWHTQPQRGRMWGQQDPSMMPRFHSMVGG